MRLETWKPIVLFLLVGRNVNVAHAASPTGGSGSSSSKYSLGCHLDFDPSCNRLSATAVTETHSIFDISPPVVPRGGSQKPLVETAAFFSNRHNSAFKSSSVASWLEDLSDDEDDDDDDDNDGHSAMLANASLRKPAAAATIAFTETPASARSVAISMRGGGLSPSSVLESEFSRRLFVAAAVTLLYEGAIGHMLEFVKIVMQTSPLGTSYGQVLRTITGEKGLAGIWDGFVPWGVVQAIGKGGVFGLAHAMALHYLKPLGEKNILHPKVLLTLAGGIAGGCQGYVLSPTLLLKTRVMTDPVFRESMSVLKTTWLSLCIGANVISKEGIGALMKGSNVFATKRVFDWSTRYYFSDFFEGVLLKRAAYGQLTAGEKISASLLGGTVSTILTLPLDVLVAKTQDAKKAGESVSAIQLFQDELKQGGWKGLKDSYLQGFEARLLHVCFTTVAMKTGTALLYEHLFPN
eukprot:CAMPEP_0194355988 /NCGR_PEP_ID=MMETSP0174-20130528/3815_1 /TAXON_ID=216777 /ORGANISM="Proboscia alata, Strain PI-D3" /LENGTH=463 /DNA_ID=CAMNT_0039125487 /DNA_START=20 /DNA_END=1411 /DNA_ORIENTATION=+